MFECKFVCLEPHLDDPKLGMKVARVGVELEGAWEKVPEGVAVVHDGSVNFERDPSLPALSAVGEIPSPPLLIDNVLPWLQSYYPQHINATCGMHVHMSFSTAYRYLSLMDPAYPPTIVEYITRWAQRRKLGPKHQIWGRLEGTSIFCQHHFFPDPQATTQHKRHEQVGYGHRYTVINYPYRRTGTVECRLLPMMVTVEQAYDAISTLLKITSAFLVVRAGTRRKFPVVLHQTTEPEISQENHIVV